MMLSVVFVITAAVLCYDCSASLYSSSKLNIHIVPHSHDDPGWLKTMDQYYTGTNASIYPATVQNIFESVMDELLKDAGRTFTFCEISFFGRWWSEQSDKMKNKVRKMVNDGQISFVNGAYVMHDEASAHYMSMIDQTTLGHRFLLEELNFIPKVGWQIDPFGHSNTHAHFSSEFGFDALFFGRIDYQDRAQRKENSNLEFIWKGSASTPESEVFTGVFSDGNYQAPPNLCLDTTCSYCANDPVVNDQNLETYNLPFKTQALIDYIESEHSFTQGSHIMVKLGADFTYDNARSWYNGMDKIMEHLAEHPKYNIFYSNPTIYMEAKANETAANGAVEWTSKTDDFFPYSDTAHAFWSGYFTSRPSFKYLERVAASFLQVYKQITSSSSVFKVNEDVIRTTEMGLTAAVGLVNHHDALTGTAKQHVTDDYKKILSGALVAAEASVTSILAERLQLEGLTTCRYSNESRCEVSENMDVESNNELQVLVYNPLPRIQQPQIKLFMSDVVANNYVTIECITDDFDEQHTSITGAIIPNIAASPDLDEAPYILTFTADKIAALGFAGYVVKITASKPPVGTPVAQMTVYEQVTPAGADRIFATVDKCTAVTDGTSLQVSNGIVSVEFNTITGLMVKLSNELEAVEVEMSNEIKFYTSFGSESPGYKHVADDRDPHLKNLVPDPRQDSASSQASGAYIFRTSSAREIPHSPMEETALLYVNVNTEGVFIYQKFSNWTSQMLTLSAGSDALDVDYTIGEVPIGDMLGKEVITQYTTNMNTKGSAHTQHMFYTDSNSREYMPRTFNQHATYDSEVFEPIAGNYYPITSGVYVKDEGLGVQLSVLTDRSVGAASMKSGEVELLVQRRLLLDDNRGVGEPLNETLGSVDYSQYPEIKYKGKGITVRGRNRLILSKMETGMKHMRVNMDKSYMPVTVFLAPTQQHANDRKQLTGGSAIQLSHDLPVNVQLATYQRISSTEVLVRLAHQFSVDEDEMLSRNVEVNIKLLFNELLIKQIDELTLSTNQLKDVQMKNKILWSELQAIKNGDEKYATADASAKGHAVMDGTVTLKAMEIRTFLLHVVD